MLCCGQENFLQKWENIEEVGDVYISIVIKIITRSAEGFLPATSPSVLSAGRVITFKLLHNLKWMTSDKAFQAVMVTQSSPWGQDLSGNVNISLQDRWIMPSSNNRNTKKKSTRFPYEAERHSICGEVRRNYVFSQPNIKFHQEVLDCQMHEPLQLAEHPDEMNLFTVLDPSWTIFPIQEWSACHWNFVKACLESEIAALLCFMKSWMSLSLRVACKKDKLGEGD